MLVDARAEHEYIFLNLRKCIIFLKTKEEHHALFALEYNTIQRKYLHLRKGSVKKLQAQPQ